MGLPYEPRLIWIVPGVSTRQALEIAQNGSLGMFFVTDLGLSWGCIWGGLESCLVLVLDLSWVSLGVILGWSWELS